MIGLAFALLALVAASALDDGRWDAAGSVAIGLVLVAVAIFLAVEVKSLLVGEAADPAVEATARQLVADDPRMAELISCIAVQQAPGEVLVALRIRFEPHLTADALSLAIDEFESRLRAERPSVRWCFVEPERRPAAPGRAQSGGQGL